MAIKRLTEALEDQDDRADITPLIDVIFMLLLFFIITTTFAEDTFFPIELPRAQGTELRTPQHAVTLEVTRIGEFALNRQPIYSQNELYRQLRTLKSQGRVQTVILKIDEQAPSRHLVFVLDTLHALDIQEFAFTAAPPQ
jgi:biopolymer transport protein ExbD